ncbi:DUF397 domain-containing protein [Streptomyces turgidiscabies]|uniref:Putative toxin-antitoxin system, toxin component n=1 Tax=Streptomyces turgidiscabies (strain Car8) TaxID=698760 RepID=L7FA82_STRT8|nr:MULTISPECIES: DUF397 domain-containing protein [Streptomyces]ELP68127.1 putative toxin-antitoxin system, toxin component [Streptomyces turgidiscabies Car8]MDX3492873.1 DUF397 domain-containing protein [Streptomyces turgidiscabies]GAQ74243.1 hypothetical protein T45_06015 [Streptomyces turgidiscabies]
MRAIDLSSVTWRKSSYSNSDGGQCIEVSDNLPAIVPVRDSKAPDRGALLIEAGAWSAFVGAVKGAGI